MKLYLNYIGLLLIMLCISSGKPIENALAYIPEDTSKNISLEADSTLIANAANIACIEQVESLEQNNFIKVFE